MITSRLIPLTEPYVRASYTAPAYTYSYGNGTEIPVSTLSML